MSNYFHVNPKEERLNQMREELRERAKREFGGEIKMINTRNMKTNGDVDLTQQSLYEIMKSMKKLQNEVPMVFEEIKRRLNKMDVVKEIPCMPKSIITIEVKETIKSFFTPDVTRWRKLVDDNGIPFTFSSVEDAINFANISDFDEDVRIVQIYNLERECKEDE